MHIGTALFLIAVIWFAIAYPGFRKLLLVGAAIVVLVVLGLIIDQTNASRQNATYRLSSHEGTVPAPTPTPTPQASKPVTNSDLLINSILRGPSSYVPTKDKFVAGDEEHCPADYAWDWQNRSCRLESSFRAVCVGPGC